MDLQSSLFVVGGEGVKVAEHVTQAVSIWRFHRPATNQAGLRDLEEKVTQNRPFAVFQSCVKIL